MGTLDIILCIKSPYTLLYTLLYTYTLLRMQRSIVEEAVGWKGRRLVRKVWHGCGMCSTLCAQNVKDSSKH